MAAQAALVLTDAEGTPVNRSFGPRGGQKENSVPAVWEYLPTGAAVAARNRATMLLRAPTPNSDSIKLTLKLEQPILEAVAGQTPAGYTPSPKVAFTMLGVVELTISARASLQERKNQLAMLRDFIDEAIITSAIESFEPVY
jgi:hypothetical protein